MRPFKHTDMNKIKIDYNKFIDNVSNVHGQGSTYRLLKFVMLETLEQNSKGIKIDKKIFNQMFDDLIFDLEEEIAYLFEQHYNENNTTKIEYINKPNDYE